MSNAFHYIEIILYVADQERSMAFYRDLFNLQPDIHVQGMTEFKISEQVKLGLMPNSGIVIILGDTLPHPDSGTGIPRCEIYLMCDSISGIYDRVKNLGVRIISPPQPRDWGHTVCYCCDPDGHIIALAEKT